VFFMVKKMIEVDENENMYETLKFVLEDLTKQSKDIKNAYKHMYDNCKEYDKDIFQRMYTNGVKHYKMLKELLKILYKIDYNDTNETIKSYKKYDSEKCIMDTYDMLDDYTKLYTNIEDKDGYKDMIFEIIQDLQKNISMLNLVYMGEE